MRLYIVRHASAYDRKDWPGGDAARPLTREGRERAVRFFTSLFKERNVSVDALWSSPAVRALQTAHIAGGVLNLPVWCVDALACGADWGALASHWKKTAAQPEKLMVVGHEPDCGEIIGALSGDPNGVYALKKAGVALLTGELKKGGMSRVWSVQPDK